MVRISFDINHPAHYLLFRNVILNSHKLGFEPLIFIQEKDRLIDLIQEDNLKGYVRINKKTTLSRASLLPKDIIQIRHLMKKENVIANFGKMSIVGSWAARSLNRRSIVLDDTDTAPEQIFLFRWPATEIWCPQGYKKKLGAKQKFFNGIFPLVYLHPSVFKPDKSIPESLGLLERGKPIIIRLIEYQAGHDWKYRNKKENIYHIIKELDKDYDILLSIEGQKCPEKLKKYCKSFRASDYHHILAHSKLYIGSGASTAGEAAVLGVPTIYTNELKPFYINMFEEKYGIIKAMHFKKLSFNSINSILKEPEAKWSGIRKRILDDFIEMPKFIQNLVEREIATHLNK